MPHWTDSLTNVSDSVRQRLRNVSRETNETMQVVLIRYATERLMYRLSLTRYRDRFILKGAWLFYVWGIPRRTTRDVDFLASFKNTTEVVIDLFTEVLQVPVPHNDGLTFDPASVRAEEIQLDVEYSGVRVRLTAMLGRTEIPTQIDLGFSEAVVEEPVRATLPVLLDFEAPELKAYSPEVVVAEKLEAIVKLGTVTTRFKDFFDLYILSNEKAFDAPVLVRQVAATFAHRGTAVTGDLPVALTDDFARNPESQRQWEAFLRRNDVVGAPELFGDAVGRVRDSVFPILQAAAQEGGFLEESWSPQGGWP